MVRRGQGPCSEHHGAPEPPSRAHRNCVYMPFRSGPDASGTWPQVAVPAPKVKGMKFGIKES